MEITAITYIGRNSGFVARFGRLSYEFEWQKSRGVGTRVDEISPKHANKLAKWRDKKGKKIFRIE